MRTTDLFQAKTTFSFEVFPPKRTGPIDTIYSTLDELQRLHPDFISVTYGAGGSENCAATLEIASAIKHKYKIESVAHLPGTGLTKADVLDQLRQFKAAGIENILALRGDIPSRAYFKGEFPHVNDLITFIKENGDFNIIAACYPEAMRDTGNAYAIDQIVDRNAQGLDGIHLYTMNNPYIAEKIYTAVHRLIAA